MTRSVAAFVLGGVKSVPSNHMLLNVLCPHHNFTKLFLVPLNERESQGTATNGRCCTVTCVGISWLSEADSHPALATQIPTFTAYGKTPVRKLQLSRTAFRLHNLHLCISNLPTLNTCNQMATTLHVSTNSQHVLDFMFAIMTMLQLLLQERIC